MAFGQLARPARRALTEPLLVRVALTTVALAFLLVFLFVPFAFIFVEAFRNGWQAYVDAIQAPEALSAIWLTLLVAALTVPANAVFGIAAAWAITRFDFRGKRLLTTLIDLPFAVSPVVAGLIFVQLFGRQGWFGPWLFEHDIKIIFAVPGIVLATIFVSFPFVARELIAVMEASGREEEEAASLLGANGWQMFRRVTLPNVKWALISGVILCTARAMGEFGAVSVVSGRIRGETTTLPIHVEILYNEYAFQASFAVASLLALVAVFTLVLQTVVERRNRRVLGFRRSGRKDPESDMSIEVRNATRAFGSFQALRGINLTVPTGQFLALLGPSGSGKTTLLRIIAGLDRADEGAVFINGQDATEQGARGRNVGFVFQHYALFRHMSVFENVAFGMRVRPRQTRPTEEQIRARVDELLALVQLDFLAHRLPSELSGGQRQRVALARALAVQPAVLLLDEPFGALDAKVRQELRSWLRRLHDEIGLTSVFVTHDQEEALELADRVIIFNHGVIEQDGTPEEVVDHPATPFVANFVGRVNVFHGRLESGKAWFGPVVVDHPTPADGTIHAEGYARPHELDVTREDVGGGLWATDQAREPGRRAGQGRPH